VDGIGNKIEGDVEPALISQLPANSGALQGPLLDDDECQGSVQEIGDDYF
jgi:hypothetical protein